MVKCCKNGKDCPERLGGSQVVIVDEGEGAHEELVEEEELDGLLGSRWLVAPCMRSAGVNPLPAAVDDCCAVGTKRAMDAC